MSRSVEWLNANKYRKYPFIEDSRPSSSFGEDLSDAVIVDFRSVNYVHIAARLSLTSIELLTPVTGPRVANFTFTYDPVVAFFDMVLSVPENASFPFKSSIYEDQSIQTATCVFGEGTSALFQYPDGTYLVGGLQIEPALVGLQGNHQLISVQSADPAGSELYGTVYFEGKYNCDIIINNDTNTVTIAAGRGRGIGVSCEDDTAGLITCRNVLCRINGLTSNDRGEFLLGGAAGIVVESLPDDNVIAIRSTLDTEEIRDCG